MMEAHHLKSTPAAQVITTVQLQVAGVTRHICIKLRVEIRVKVKLQSSLDNGASCSLGSLQ